MNNHIYTLRNKNWSCTICPTMGANIISLRHHNNPILREPQDLACLENSPVLFGCPILLPPNRTCGGKFIYAEKEYTLPINESEHGNHLHGSLHSASFEVLSSTATTICSRLINRGAHFPFPFRITFTDQLCEDGFIRSVEVYNTGSTCMPLAIGFHTNFTAPDFFSVPIGRRWAVNEHHIPTGEQVELTKEQLYYRDGCLLSGQRVNGFYTAVGNVARIGNYLFTVEGFDQWILFNGDGSQGFLCIEPQLGPVNALNSGKYHKLGSGKTHQLMLKISSLEDY